MNKIKSFVEGKLFQNTILFVIVFNSILMGVATSDGIMAGPAGNVINILDYVCLGIFVIELILKVIAYNKNFLKDPWNIFDFLIIVICLIPNLQFFSAIRAVRILKVFKTFKSLRALRMVSGFRKLRIIVTSIFDSIPGILWTGLLLLLDFYIFAILGTTLFGSAFPDWFGNIGKSLYTLFQVMTLESWSMGISRPVMEVYSWAWVYFVPFVIISAFIVMNVVVGIVVNTISETTDKIAAEDLAAAAEKKAKWKAKKGIISQDAASAPVADMSSETEKGTVSASGESGSASENGSQVADGESAASTLSAHEHYKLRVELEALKIQIGKIESILNADEGETE
ncbi:MAG: ion transporter [Lachnospiraceae bacterium]|nr:ion transporter [Candidatus Merdinaster equi]